MENIFAQVIGKDEMNKSKLLSENKSKAEKIVRDLKTILPLGSMQREGFDSIHIGHLSDVYNCVVQSQIRYTINGVFFCGMIDCMYPQREIFESYTYQNLLDDYEDKECFSRNWSYPIEIDLTDKKGLEVAYWLIKRVVLGIKY